MKSTGFELHTERTPIGALLRDVSRSRELIWILARKEFYVRYRRASFGILWAVAIPLTQAVVLAVVMGRIARFDVGVDLAVFIFAGTLPFSYLTGTLSGASTSIVDNSQICSRVYFPRIVLPLMVSVSNVYGLASGLIALLCVFLALGNLPGLSFLLLVPAIALAVLLATSLAVVASALHVYFRDVRYMVAAASTVWFYATPVFYPIDLLDGWMRRILIANPATGMVQLFKAAFGIDVPDLGLTVMSTLVFATIMLTVGTILHSRWDRVFADLL